jgi:hypothetical protein
MTTVFAPAHYPHLEPGAIHLQTRGLPESPCEEKQDSASAPLHPTAPGLLGQEETEEGG